MSKMPWALRPRPKLSEAEIAIAEERTVARLADLFPHADAPAESARRRSGGRPPIVVEGDSDLIGLPPEGGIETLEGLPEDADTPELVGVMDVPSDTAELVSVVVTRAPHSELVGVMELPAWAEPVPMGAAGDAAFADHGDLAGSPMAEDPIDPAHDGVSDTQPTLDPARAEPDGALPVADDPAPSPALTDLRRDEPSATPGATADAMDAAPGEIAPTAGVAHPRRGRTAPPAARGPEKRDPTPAAPKATAAPRAAVKGRFVKGNVPASKAAATPRAAPKAAPKAAAAPRAAVRAAPRAAPKVAAPRAAPKGRSANGNRPAPDARLRPSTARPVARVSAQPTLAVPTALCPSCALLLEPPPTSSRRCPRCRQPIVVKRVEGRTAYLTEAAVAIFETQRQKASDSGRLARERERWLKLAIAAGAPTHKAERMAAAHPSADVVEAARQLYLAAAKRAFLAAKRDHQWKEASRIRRDQAVALHRLAGAPLPPPDDLVSLYREGVAAELRGLAEIVRDAELVSATCCETCRDDHGRISSIGKELKAPRLPHPGCPRVFCRCTWDLAPRDRELVLRYVRRRPRAASRPAATG